MMNVSGTPAGIKKEILLLISLIVLGTFVYYRIIANERNLMTGLVFLSGISVFLFFLYEISARIFRLKSDTKNSHRLLIISVTVSLIGLEIFLRVGLNKYSNYYEKNGSKNYQSIYEYDNSKWFWVHYPGEDLRWTKTEFTHIRKTNSLGLSEKEIPLVKGKDEIRIIALGDSYTEGVGTSYESTWAKVVERNLTRSIPNKKITVINAGISGSDPFFEYVLLKEKLLVFKPDFVIVAINHSDIDDIILRGGMERFQTNGTVSFRKPPKWEWIYSISYIFRHIIHDLFQYDWLLMKKSEREYNEQMAMIKMKGVLEKFDGMAKEIGFGLLIVFHPHEYEVKNERYESKSFSELISGLMREKRLPVIDLLDDYKKNLMNKDNYSEFFWKIDMHHNTKGYEAMGNAIGSKITEMGLIAQNGGA